MRLHSLPRCAASADFAFEKVASVLPVVAVIGGSEQEFSVASGIRVQTAIDLSTVCPGWEGGSRCQPASQPTSQLARRCIRVPAVSPPAILPPGCCSLQAGV